MSDVVCLESRRKPAKPVRYYVEIEHYADGTVTVFLEGISESRHNRKAVSQVLRHAADIILDPPPESHS